MVEGRLATLVFVGGSGSVSRVETSSKLINSVDKYLLSRFVLFLGAEE
jgi:hypothetical protein